MIAKPQSLRTSRADPEVAGHREIDCTRSFCSPAPRYLLPCPVAKLKSGTPDTGRLPTRQPPRTCPTAKHQNTAVSGQRGRLARGKGSSRPLMGGTWREPRLPDRLAGHPAPGLQAESAQERGWEVSLTNLSTTAWHPTQMDRAINSCHLLRSCGHPEKLDPQPVLKSMPTGSMGCIAARFPLS